MKIPVVLIKEIVQVLSTCERDFSLSFIDNRDCVFYFGGIIYYL